MEISSISIKNDGYIYCKSKFYSVHDILSHYSCYTFSRGVNKLIGEIDSGIWAISYLLSMYKHSPEDFVLFDPPEVTVNNKVISLNELSEYSCYIDNLCPLFSMNKSVKEHIIEGLEQSKLNYSYNDIKNLFHIDSMRFEQPLKNVGNEGFKAMSAIGFSHKKEIFCFPWLSNNRFLSYHKNITGTLQTLKELDKIVIVPVGISTI